MKRSATLLFVPAGLAALAFTTYFALRTGPDGASASSQDVRLPVTEPRELDRAEVVPPQEPRSAVEEPVPAEVESPSAPVPVDPPAAEAPAVDTVGDPSSWPGEYANQPVEVLVAEEKRLRSEHEAELKAEIDKRFDEGRVETYRQGEQPKDRVTFGVEVSRGDETHIRYVVIDPRIEPRFWRKSNKANWLAQEIQRRQRGQR